MFPRFLELPPEIRQRIYQEVIATHHLTHIYCENNSPGKPQTLRRNPSISSTPTNYRVVPKLYSLPLVSWQLFNEAPSLKDVLTKALLVIHDPLTILFVSDNKKRLKYIQDVAIINYFYSLGFSPSDFPNVKSAVFCELIDISPDHDERLSRPLESRWCHLCPQIRMKAKFYRNCPSWPSRPSPNVKIKLLSHFIDRSLPVKSLFTKICDSDDLGEAPSLSESLQLCPPPVSSSNTLRTREYGVLTEVTAERFINPLKPIEINLDQTEQLS